jgi:hypothetical protein
MMKIVKIAVALGVLFAIAPAAAPKGRSGTSITFSVTCDGNDGCTASGSGLVPGKLYEVQVFDNCSGLGPAPVDQAAAADGTLSVTFDLSNYDGCTGADNWLFTLYSFGGKRLQTLASFQASEPN